MKKAKYIQAKIYLPLVLVIITLMSCERDLSDNVVAATFASTAEIFTDVPVGLGSNFYLPFADSKLDAFSVDNEVGFESAASYRVDVPNANNPTGNYAGAILRIDGDGRDLSGFDALTFYARASQGVSIDAVGLGQDFLENKYLVTVNNTSVGTNWAKYTIPIPDATNLLQERGVFWYAAGTQKTGGSGYVLWFDEIKFEKLGTVAQPRPAILNGNDETTETFNGAILSVEGLTQTFNLANGQDITVGAAPSYFTFTSSDESVATVNELGVVNVTGIGTASITASLNGTDATGSLTVTSNGDLTEAPIPPAREPENVSSIFSDAYTPATASNFTPGFLGSTTATSEITVNGDSFLTYSANNFTGILFENNINTSALGFLHVDVYVQNASTDFEIQIRDVGANGMIETNVFNGLPSGDDVDYRFNINGLTANGWTSFDIPLAGDLATQKNNLGALILVGGPDFILDNIYFYKEVINPTPNVDDSAATQVAFPVGFQSTTLTYNIGVFGGIDSAIETNPDQSGINTTSTVLRSTKSDGAEFWAGTTLELDSPVDFSSSQKVRMKVWSPKSEIPVRIKLENSANTAQFVELDANTSVANQWEELEWDFSSTNFNLAPFDRAVIFFEFTSGVSGDGSIYYCDDIKILN